MLTCCVKFCGGCNPRYDRGEAYKRIREALEGEASFSLPEEGAEYDVLLILRGCTGCPYLYEEEVRAKHRIPVHSREEAGAFPAQLRKLMAEQQDS
ncbi:hypothetical protein D7X33_06860 [Butyricicoccus sp. 1XD8-22]|nr:hypothetical protein D7X33_06860 [Butyricicoccus sp. 1XD8-22]